jgi:hypothetical protein
MPVWTPDWSMLRAWDRVKTKCVRRITPFENIPTPPSLSLFALKHRTALSSRGENKVRKIIQSQCGYARNFYDFFQFYNMDSTLTSYSRSSVRLPAGALRDFPLTITSQWHCGPISFLSNKRRGPINILSKGTGTHNQPSIQKSLESNQPPIQAVMETN